MATKRKAEYIIPQDEQIDRYSYTEPQHHQTMVNGLKTWNNEGQILNSAPGVIDWPYMRGEKIPPRRENPGMSPAAWKQAVASVYGPTKTPIYGGDA